MSFFGQSYSALWKKVQEAGQKDLPKTEYEVLQQIVDKATKEKAYGQLLKAELQGAQVMTTVSPDSLKPAVERIQQRCASTKEEVLKPIYQTVLYRICNSNPGLEMTAEKPVLTPQLCRKLAAVRDETYDPFVITRVDSKVFDHDLLSVVGYELEDFEPLHDYYEQTGNRQAACLLALRVIQQRYNKDTENVQKSEYLHKIDSAIARYEDLPEAGELAIEHYHFLESSYSATAEEKIRYIHYALGKWGSWRRMNVLRNAEMGLTNPQLTAKVDMRVSESMHSRKVELTSVRNISTLKMTVYKVRANGDIDLNPENSEHYKKLKPLLQPTGIEVERKYIGKPAYEVFDDSLTLEGLPLGLYMIEIVSDPETRVVRWLYYVTDLFTMAEEQPQGKIRYVVVNSTTGQPVANAHVRVKQYITYKKTETHHLKTDNKGECIYDTKGNSSRPTVYVYTDDDKACQETSIPTRFSYYGGREIEERTNVYTDRAIYRPGQTVHAAAVVYQVRNGFEHQVVAGKRVTFTLRDANYKVVKEIPTVTDEYGTAAADFTLPASGLTGSFSIHANGQQLRIRVEEYKRPTFEVTFPEVKQHYEAGDTVVVKATARSYAGVPVQGATVKYEVVRRMAFWWWNYNRYWDAGVIGVGSDDTDIYSGEAVTGDDGTFPVEIPMTMPESSHPLFYNFVVTADVTDVGGETHSGQLSLPLGNRKTALSVDMKERVLADDKPTMTFHLLNAAGNDIEAEVNYQIDGGKWQTVKTNTRLPIPSASLKSGAHMLVARCEGDTIERQFTVFSLDDKRPATETKNWFWVSDYRFPNDGKPVTIQVGSSDKDVHIVYSIFSGEQLIESGAVDKSNELINRKLTYKKEWGDGILLTFAWVKESVCYTHSTTINRPLPPKQMTLVWNTFRDKLKPGQEEEWTLTVTGPDGKPADAMLMATLYDKSLDQLTRHHWSLVPYVSLSLPHTSWGSAMRNWLYASVQKGYSGLSVKDFNFSRFDESVFPSLNRHIVVRGFGNSRRLAGSGLSMKALAATAVADEMAVEEAAPAVLKEVAVSKQTASESQPEEGDTGGTEQVQMRENLNETAFFYPQLTTDAEGHVALKFTLPESLTTWRFMGLAHTKDMCYGQLSGEAVAQKDVMVQPNIPRFLREGDKATISTRIFNLCERDVKGTATLKLINPETDEVVFETSEPFSLGTNATANVAFQLSSLTTQQAPLICQVSASGEGFSDGEQHYLPILPSSDRITVTLPFTQHEPGKKILDLGSLIPADGSNARMTVEYTNNPAWLMVQALPAIGKPIDDNAISQAASYYANRLGQFLIQQNPKAKTAFQLWQQETGSETSLMSSLEKNQELKDLVLSETPWVLDAERETEQKQRLADFFDENLMQNRLSSALNKLQKLQLSEGSWSWWEGMRGSFYMTVAISEMLVRLNAMTGRDAAPQMLDKAFKFMGNEIVKEVAEMKKEEKKGHRQVFPSFKTLQWLYLATLDGRELPNKVQEANNYLLGLLKKEIKNQTLYEKALTAVILTKSDAKLAAEYVQSLKEYTVYSEEMGRYYDAPRASYSWYDYRIPTQTVAIEALQRITPNDRQTIIEMQRWLLQSKRTQAWDTPINSVNAVYAFLGGGSEPLALNAPLSTFTLDGQPLEMPKATAAIGYMKTTVPAESRQMEVEKTSEGTSWGAVYAQFTQPTHNVKDTGSGLQVTREVIAGDHLSVGDRVKVRITIQADRDYDFVQVIDKRAACLEPVRQLSGYHEGSYCTPRDNSTNYYFDCLSKGKHVIESEYFIDRPGTYETGVCTVSCAYSPEFRGTTKSVTLNVK